MTIEIQPIKSGSRFSEILLKRKRFTPIKLNASGDVALLSSNIQTLSSAPSKQMLFSGFSEFAKREARGSDSKLFEFLNLSGNAVVEKVLGIIDSKVKNEKFLIDIEDVSHALFESLRDLYYDFLGKLYKDLDVEEKQILRELVIAAVDYHNEENGLNIAINNKKHYELAKVDIAGKRLFKVLQELADGSTEFPTRDIDNAYDICIELRRLEKEKEKIIGSHSNYEFPPFSMKTFALSEVDRYGYKNGEGRREKYNFKNLKLPYGSFPLLDVNLKLSTYTNPSLTKKNNKEIQWAYMNGLGYIPVFDGIMKARNSTESFVHLLGGISGSISGEAVFQIGYSHGGITKKIAEVAGEVIGVDILEEAEKNANYTLSELSDENRNKVTLVCDDLSYLIQHVAKTKKTAKYLFFNCPIFKGKVKDLDDFNSMAGEDFGVIKRTLEMLPQVLDKDGEAYLLVGYPRTEEGKERLWTLDKLKAFLNSNIPSYECKALRGYEAEYNQHGTYGIVRINRKTTSS